jgi:hypothetical protein
LNDIITDIAARCLLSWPASSDRIVNLSWGCVISLPPPIVSTYAAGVTFKNVPERRRRMPKTGGERGVDIAGNVCLLIAAI